MAAFGYDLRADGTASHANRGAKLPKAGQSTRAVRWKETGDLLAALQDDYLLATPDVFQQPAEPAARGLHVHRLHPI